MAVHEVNSTEYATLETELEKTLPYSICVFNHLKLLRRDLVTEKAVLVDSWPDFSAVAIVDTKRKNALPIAVSFCKEPDFSPSLEILLRHAFEVLTSPIIIFGLTTVVTDALVKSFKDEGTCPVREKERVLVFTLPPDKTVPLKTPDGFQISELKQCHVENVHNSWTQRHEFKKYGDLRVWIRNLISNLQTVCIKTEDGRPVAWELQHDYGGIGMLYVEPEYRRAKLGSVVTRALARKLVEDGNLVFALVNYENKASFDFHDKNGYILMPFKLSIILYSL